MSGPRSKNPSSFGMSRAEVDGLAWDKGLLPAIVQDCLTQQVLMVGYMNQEALAQTLAEKKVFFFSRSKQRLWMKGETSGHYLELMSVRADCDRDALLVQAFPHGSTCHRGTVSCFSDLAAPGIGFLGYLERLIESRDERRPAGSYTTSLFEKGVSRIAQKVGEEGVEVALSAVQSESSDLPDEAADLLFHLLVLLRAKKIPIGDVIDVLRRRHTPSVTP